MTLTDALWQLEGRTEDTTGKLLPTPNASDGPKGGPNRRDGKGEAYLSGISRLLPTPIANPDNRGAGGELRAALEHGPERRNRTGVDSLGRPNQGRPSKLLPTPAARDWKDTGDLSGVPENSLLPRVIDRLLPTPPANEGGAADHYDPNAPSQSGRSLKTWAKSTGAPTPPPSTSGSESSDELHPGQLTIEDA